MCDCSEKEPIGRLIYYMAQDLGKFAEKILKPFDLTLEQLHIIKILPDKNGITQKEIGTAVNKTPANITRLLDRLEEKKLVERRSDPNDRRATLVFITKTGKSTVENVTETFNSFSSQFLQGVSDQEKETIRTAFAKITTNLQNLGE